MDGALFTGCSNRRQGVAGICRRQCDAIGCFAFDNE